MFDSQLSLVKAVETVNIGTLAFVLSDELLYIKSSGGWRTVVVRRPIKPCELSIRYRIVCKASDLLTFFFLFHCPSDSLLGSRLSECHATLPRKGERYVTSRKTVAKEITLLPITLHDTEQKM